MRMRADEFRDMPYKRLTLMGMSGVGKTHFSTMLSRWGWVHHSCDYVIAQDLADHLDRPTTIEDMSALSEFVGKIGDPAKGGLELGEFQKRQKMYYDAECQSLQGGLALAQEEKGAGFVNDSTGSLCELDEPALIERVGEETLIIYIEASEEGKKDVLERAQLYPKPLFYPQTFFEERLQFYLAEQGLAAADQVDPDEFARWVFPFLFAARLPKYEGIAERYGVTIAFEDFIKVKNAEEFLEVIASALEEWEVMRVTA